MVSVVMITYGHEKFIAEAIDGVLMQEINFPVELIIANDCSPDNTDIIIQKYIKEDPKGQIIKYFLQEKNIGMMPNFIIALHQAQGKYVAICEGDDYWTDPLKLQKQVNFLEEHEDYGLVWTDVDFYIQSSGVFKKAVFKNKIIPVRDSFIDVLINRSFLAPPTWLLRREYLLKGINDYCDGSFAWILDILAETKIKYLDEVTAVYRQLNRSASHHPCSINRYRRSQGIYRIQKDYLKKYKLSNEVEEAVDLKYYESIYPYVVIFGDKENIQRGKAVLKKSTSKSMKIKVSLVFSNFFLGIYILKFTYRLRDKFSK